MYIPVESDRNVSLEVLYVKVQVRSGHPNYKKTFSHLPLVGSSHADSFVLFVPDFRYMSLRLWPPLQKQVNGILFVVLTAMGYDTDCH